jgi:hypothetical protein
LTHAVLLMGDGKSCDQQIEDVLRTLNCLVTPEGQPQAETLRTLVTRIERCSDADAEFYRRVSQ